MTLIQVTAEPLEIKTMSGYFGQMKPILLITLGSTLIDAFFNDQSEVALVLTLLILMLLATAVATMAALRLRRARTSK